MKSVCQNDYGPKVKGVWPEKRNGRIAQWIAQFGTSIGSFRNKQAAVRQRRQWEQEDIERRRAERAS